MGEQSSSLVPVSPHGVHDLLSLPWIRVRASSKPGKHRVLTDCIPWDLLHGPKLLGNPHGQVHQWWYASDTSPRVQQLGGGEYLNPGRDTWSSSRHLARSSRLGVINLSGNEHNADGEQTNQNPGISPNSHRQTLSLSVFLHTTSRTKLITQRSQMRTQKSCKVLMDCGRTQRLY